MNTHQDEQYYEAFKRNLGLISKEDQEKLRNSRIAIAGLGGGGGTYVVTMARLGVGKMNISDLDTFELANMNRQAGANMSTLGHAKAEVIEKMAKDINPDIEIKNFPQGINPENIDEFLNGVDVVLDGIDFFNIDTRMMLFQEARKKGITVVTCAPIGFGGTLLVFTPNGMSMEDYFDIQVTQTREEKLLQFGLGLSPSLIHRKYYAPEKIDFKNKSAPSAILSISLCANLAGNAAYKVITGRKIKAAPWSMQFDPYVEKLRKVYLWKGNKNPIQLLKKWYVKRKVNM